MLQIARTHWFSSDVTVTEESRHVADIAMSLSWWREEGALTIDGATFSVYREPSIFGGFVLEHAGSVLARAEKPDVLRHKFVISHADRDYTLRPERLLSLDFVLLDGSRRVGEIFPVGIGIRKATADLPDDLPLPVRLFIVWLAVNSWSQE